MVGGTRIVDASHWGTICAWMCLFMLQVHGKGSACMVRITKIDICNVREIHIQNVSGFKSCVSQQASNIAEVAAVYLVNTSTAGYIWYKSNARGNVHLSK